MEAVRRPPATCQGGVLPVTERSHAVFLSYVSQDAEAAQRICHILRAAGIERPLAERQPFGEASVDSEGANTQ
jgi:hypothetical protein